MAAGSTARQFHTQQIHFLRKSVDYTQDGEVLTVGVLPAGATIIKPISGVNVDVAFDAGTNNLLDIGNSSNDDLFGTNLALGSIAFVPVDEAVAMTVSAETTVTATVDLTGTAATAGNGEIVIAYVPDIDG